MENYQNEVTTLRLKGVITKGSWIHKKYCLQ